MRAKVKKQTWTNGTDVYMPYQQQQDYNRSIMGVLGRGPGPAQPVIFFTRVYRNQRKEQVLDFLETFMAQQFYPPD